MTVFWSILFGWLPAPIGIAFAGLLALFILFLIVRIVTLILGALPFV